MMFRLARQLINNEINKIVAREVRKQKVYVLNASKQVLKDLALISSEIESKGLPSKFVCKKLPKKLGYGIFLHPEAEPIVKGELIAPYAGEISFVPQYSADDSVYAFAPISDILLSKEEQAHFDQKNGFHPRRLYQLNVDSVRKGNFTRFVNHSYKPNVLAEFYKIPVNSFGLSPAHLEVVYIAKKTIKPGEQLLICYDGDGPTYWGALGIKPVPVTPTTFQLDRSLKLFKK